MANCPPLVSPSPGVSAPRGPSPSTLPVTQTWLLGDGEGAAAGARRGWGGQGRGSHSPRSLRAPAHWHHGSGCGRAGGCSCAPPWPPAPPRPPPSAPGRPAAWALHQRQLRAPSTQHHPLSTTAQGTVPQGSPSPLAFTTQLSPGDIHQGGGVLALLQLGDTSTYLGTGGRQPVPRATSSLRKQGVSGQEGGGHRSGACRGLTWHPLPLAQPPVVTRISVCRDMELGAQRRLEAPEGHPALCRKTTTMLWRGTGTTSTHLPGARATGPPHNRDALVPAPTSPHAAVPGDCRCGGHPSPAPCLYIPGVGQAAQGPGVPRPPRPRSGRRHTCAQRAAVAR